MWIFSSWLFKLRFRKLPFIVDNICQTFQSECREEIKKEFDGITRQFPAILTRLKLKDAKERMHATYTPIVGKTVILKHPIFTAHEVEKTKTNMKVYLFVLVLLLIFESLLYSLMGTIFIPKKIRDTFVGTEFIFGFAFALIFVAALHFAFKNLWTFLEAKQIINTEKLDKKELVKFYPNLVLSLFILSLFLITNTYTGFIRAKIIDPASTASSSSSSSSLLDTISGPVLVLSVMVTFIVALVMALLERDISEKYEKYRIYRNWYKQQKERKVYNTAIRKMLQNCNETIRLKIEKYWSLMKDVHRALGREYDEKHEELFMDLRKRLENNEMDLSNIDDSTYRHYRPVASTCLALFTYGILLDPMMQKTLSELDEVKVDIEKFESTFISEADSDIDSGALPHVI
jgi:hypothetical protein